MPPRMDGNPLMSISIPPSAADASASTASLPNATSGLSGTSTGSNGARKGRNHAPTAEFALVLGNAKSGSATGNASTHKTGTKVDPDTGQPVKTKEAAPATAADSTAATQPATLPADQSMPVVANWMGFSPMQASYPPVGLNPEADEAADASSLQGLPFSSKRGLGKDSPSLPTGTSAMSSPTAVAAAADPAALAEIQARVAAGSETIKAPALPGLDEAKGNDAVHADSEEATNPEATPVADAPGRVSSGLGLLSSVYSASEKIAASPSATARPVKSSISNSDKHSQVSIGKQLTSSTPSVGTSGAKSDAVMPFDSSSRQSADAATAAAATASVSRIGMVTAASGGAAQAATLPSSETYAIPSTAEGAVQTVMHVVDLQASGGQSASSTINLHFKIGDSNLAVRVEMQGGAVHTQFSTDSSDLRTAIGHEWQAMSGTSTGKGIHFAEPVFSSSSDSFADTGAGSSNSRQNSQNPENRYASADDLAYVMGTSASASSAAQASTTLTSAPDSASGGLSNRLLTFA